MIVVPDLDPVVALLEHGLGRLAIKASAHGGGQQGEVLLEARHHRQSDRVGGVQKRSGGVFAISHHIVGKAWSQVVHRAPQQALCGGILAVAGPVGFHVHRQRQAADAHHADQHKMMQTNHALRPWRP